MQKKYYRFKKLKQNYKKEKKKMEEEREKEKKRRTPQNYRSPAYRQRFRTTIKSVTEYTHIHIHS